MVIKTFLVTSKPNLYIAMFVGKEVDAWIACSKVN